MDKLSRIRGSLRSRFTINSDQVLEELEKEDQLMDKGLIHDQMVLLESICAKLDDHDCKIMEAMVDADKSDEDIEAEEKRVDEYKKRWISLQRLADKVLLVREVKVKNAALDSEVRIGCKKSYKLPKTELKKFSGEVMDWLSWWSQFLKIHEDEDLHDSDKFQYLVQAMQDGSKAADLIKVYPQTAANYPKAVEALRDRFGKEKVLKRVYVRELLKMIINNSREKVKISKTFDKLEGHLKALESLGITPDQMDVLLFPMVESCLPDDILLAWQRSPNYGKDAKREEPSRTEFDFLMEFVKQEVENEGQRAMAQAGFSVSRDPQRNQNFGKPRERSDVPTAASLYNKTESSNCVFCGKNNHSSSDCYKAVKMSLDEKNKKIKENNGCFICFKKGHSARKCRSDITCGKCSKRHFQIMCNEDSNRPSQVRQETEGVQNLYAGQSIRRSRSSVILMKTLRVKVIGTNGKFLDVRLLFDEGSQRSYIRSEVAEKLGCTLVKTLNLQNYLFGGQKTEVKTRKCFAVMLEGIECNQKKQFELVSEEVICIGVPQVPQGPWMSELEEKNIRLTDIWASSSEVDILIGSDLWGSFMTGKMYKLSDGLVAVESIFGWTLSGPVPQVVEESCASAVLSLLTSEKKSLEDLWSLETLGIRDSAEKISQEEHDFEVMKKLQENTVQDEEGRYIVKLPWISSSIKIPTNRKIAVRRLISATEKLNKLQMFHTYDAIFKAWEAEGIIERVPASENLPGVCSENLPGHYLPHRPVIKPESLTTPVRPVNDASAKEGNNPSLNQCLEKGPNLLELIPAILQRFRERRYGVISDIRKAFQMIGVVEDDRNFQKFLWWTNDKQEEMMEYRHCRVVFGLNCSPFILAAVVDLHLSRVKEEHRVVAEIIRKALYVDNCVNSVNDEEEYRQFREIATEIFQEGKMELRQWETNIGVQESPVTNVLGLKWDKVEDVLYCKVPKFSQEISSRTESSQEISPPEECSQEIFSSKSQSDMKITKRSVLSMVSQVYDPIGFTCPAIIQPKMMLQDSWAVEAGWDAEWNEAESSKFKSWIREIEDLGKIKIPRRAFGDLLGKVQLHMFSDASKSAYGAVVFTRVEVGNNIQVHLIAAKARLAPLDKKKLKKMTIPRLELMGCLIGSRLVESAIQSLSEKDVDVFCWSDSSTALAWIRRQEDWGTFVGRRVEEICRLTNKFQWRHVPGVMNPADLPSRGCSPKELLESHWWEGPQWLKNETQWPQEKLEVNEDEISVERRKTSVVAAAVNAKKDELRFSSFIQNVRVAAWIRRFTDNVKERKRTRNLLKRERRTPLSNQELNIGEIDLLKAIQKRYFEDKPDMKKLALIEKDGLLCVKTRLTNLDGCEDFRCPVLLPKDDQLVHQLIEYVHRNHCHAGVQFVLNKLREKYWIIHGRKTVSRVIQKCVVCRRFDVKSVETPPAPLPSFRVSSQYAFQHTGVDLAGPILIKGRKNKAWIVLYTCAMYRGVHLDVVDSLTTEDFLDSLERFTYKIGRPNTMHSDNGLNFVGADNLMKTLNWKKLEEKLQVKKINWIFNPPTAAWWGGLWERLIRSVKDLLRRMIGTAKLTKKELEKCLMSIEHTINNRPLTTLTEDSDDLIPLTPSMFMRDIPIVGFPERDEMLQGHMQASYKKMKEIKKALTERFRKEYLAMLVQRQAEKKLSTPEVGDIVLVGQDNKKRFEWPLGRIIEVFPGKDGNVRVARIKTQQGELIRPLKRLYLLEVSRGKDLEVSKEVAELAKKTSEEVSGNVAVEVIQDGDWMQKPTRYGSWNHQNL